MCLSALLQSIVISFSFSLCMQTHKARDPLVIVIENEYEFYANINISHVHLHNYVEIAKCKFLVFKVGSGAFFIIVFNNLWLLISATWLLPVLCPGDLYSSVPSFLLIPLDLPKTAYLI